MDIKEKRNLEKKNEDEESLLNSAVIEKVEPIVDNPKLSSKEKAICITRIIQQEEFSGPIPHPTIMAKYESIHPGFADRIMSMAERQNTHRIEMEANVIPEQQRQSRLGQLFAFILSVLVIVVACILIWKEEYLYGMILLTVTVLSIAALFIKGRSSIDKDIEDKQ